MININIIFCKLKIVNLKKKKKKKNFFFSFIKKTTILTIKFI